MTFSRSRRRRGRPVLEGGFPDDGYDITEVLQRAGPADWDGSTFEWGGAPGPAAEPLARLRSPGRYQPPPALPAPPPPRQPDCAVWAVLRAGGFGLLCGIDRWRIHFDPETAHARHCFSALRASAHAAGWRPDAYGRWACPRCVTDPAWAAPRLPAHYDPAVAHARSPGDWPARHWLGRRRPVTEDHPDASAAWVARDPAAEFWLAVGAEISVAIRTADAAGHGRHRAGAR